MKKFIASFFLSLFVVASANAAVVTKEVVYKDGKTELHGTIAYDETISSLRPGIVLFPEWWGHNDYVKSRAKEMAEQGYVAFAADTYGNAKVTSDPKEASKWSDAFYKDRKMMRTRALAAVNELKKQVNVDKSKVALMGFCFGGTVALELARSGEDVDGVAAFHAGLQFPDKVEKVKARVLVLNGAADPMVSFADRQKFIEEMQSSGADLEFIEYGNAVHAFTNPGADKYGIKGVGYNEKAEKRSFKQLRDFLKEIFS